MAKITIRNEIRFILNGEDVALSATSRPTRRCSTGCGSTARCAAPRKAAPRAIAAPAPCWSASCRPAACVYESVNACIRFLGSLDGCPCRDRRASARRRTASCIRCSRRWSISTARNAASARRASSCRSMACGCETPEPSDAAIEKALQGNLCRCTGYEAIMRAAHAISSYGKAANDPLAVERKAITARLAALQRRRARRDRRGQGAADRAGRRRRFRRRAATAEPDATIVAGSTDVGLWVTKQMRDISPVVFIGHLDGLRDHLGDRRRHHHRRRRHLHRRLLDAGQAHPGARRR